MTAVDEGNREPVREYVLPRRGNVSAVDRLASLLVEHGAEISRARSAFRATDGKEYPAGSYVIPAAQPAKRLVRALLDESVSIDDPFLREEEKRRRRRESSEIYDVTAWSLPLQFGVQAIPAGAQSKGSFEPFRPPLQGTVQPAEATVAYLLPWGTTAAGRFVALALKDGIRMLSSDKPFTQNSHRFPAGSMVIKVKDNTPTVHAAVRRIAEATGAEVVATETGWMDEGPNFGSHWVAYLKRPEIALAWDRPPGLARRGRRVSCSNGSLGTPLPSFAHSNSLRETCLNSM